MKRLVLFVLPLLMLVALPLRAAMAAPVTQFTLKNGLQVVVIQDHRAPAVVHMVWYKAGAADEPPGTSGIAHFLEHLMFKGTKTLKAGEFSSIVARHGGTENAFTTQDYTAFFQRVPTDQLGAVMKMEADRMANLRLSPADVKTERDVILEERNMRVDNNPGALFREQTGAAQFLNHPYGIPIIGWRREMTALSRDDALTFYHKYYAPNNAIVIVAGDTTPDEVRTLAEKYYGPVKANPDLPPRARPQEPPQLAERRLVMRDQRVAQPYVTRSYLAPARRAGDQKQAAALTILSDILGDGTTSYLARKLEFEQKVAVQAGASYDGTSVDPRTFDLYVVPAAGTTLQQAEDAMDEALTGFMETGVDPDQLARIKTQIRASQVYSDDDMMNLAERYGRGLATGLSVADVTDWPDILAAVTPDDIMKAAKQVLDRKHAVTGWLAAPEVTQ